VQKPPLAMKPISTLTDVENMLVSCWYTGDGNTTFELVRLCVA
jgi:hypothetical protein